MASALLQPVMPNLARAGAGNAEQLRDLWKLFTKVKDSMENGRRLENLSWRLWFRSTLACQKPADATLSNYVDQIFTASPSSNAPELSRSLSALDPKPVVPISVANGCTWTASVGMEETALPIGPTISQTQTPSCKTATSSVSSPITPCQTITGFSGGRANPANKLGLSSAAPSNAKPLAASTHGFSTRTGAGTATAAPYYTPAATTIPPAPSTTTTTANTTPLKSKAAFFISRSFDDDDDECDSMPPARCLPPQHQQTFMVGDAETKTQSRVIHRDSSKLVPFAKTQPIAPAAPPASTLSSLLKTQSQSRGMKISAPRRLPDYQRDPIRILDCSESLRQGLLVDRQPMFNFDLGANRVHHPDIEISGSLHGW